MNTKERIYHKTKAAHMVQELDDFDQPVIDFILFKENEGKGKYIIGLHEVDDTEHFYIFKPHGSKILKPEEDIHYKHTIEKEYFEECKEGYILFCMQDGYQLIYMVLSLHISMWEFIDCYIYHIDRIETGVKKYLTYCEEAGISKRLLEHFGDTVLEDLTEIFRNKELLHVLLSQDVGAYRLSLSYRSNTKDYLVMIRHIFMEKTEYKAYHTMLKSAVNDFLRQYYEYKIRTYEQEEKQLMNEINQLMAEEEKE